MNDDIGIVAGDVVRLKTGGPAMTVETISSTGNQANCVWFEKFGSDYGNQASMAMGVSQKWNGPFHQSFALAVLTKIQASK